jgi:chromosome partitioning protein
MRIISIANQKGGCGKTTTAINLASALGHNGKRTLLIDLDPQAHASLGLNFENQDSLYNVISKLTPRKMKIRDIIKTVENKFDIVPSNILVGTLEQELADEIGRETKLLDIIRDLRADYDYILIDCPPSLGILTVNSIRASDEVIMPVETSRFSMQGVEHLLDIVRLVRDRLNHQVSCKILITMFDSRLRHSFAMMSSIREKFAAILFDTIVHINVKLKESAVMGQTVTHYDKYCRGAKDYFRLAREITTAESPAEAPKTEAAPPAQAAAPARPVRARKEEAEPALPNALSDRMKGMVREHADAMAITTFSLKAPEARSVYVTGSFNDWSLDENCRMRLEGDQWVVKLPLPPGTYKYQFIVDGRWKEDPSNPRQERNSFGDINSLLEVGAEV